MLAIKTFFFGILIFIPVFSTDLGKAEEIFRDREDLIASSGAFKYGNSTNLGGVTRSKRQHDSTFSYISFKLPTPILEETAGKLKRIVKRYAPPTRRGKRFIPALGGLANGIFSGIESAATIPRRAYNGIGNALGGVINHGRNAFQNLLTNAMGLFQKLNSNLPLAENLVNLPEIRGDPILSKSIVINPRGVTCADACDPEPENVFGTIGICTETYCICHSAQGNQPRNCGRDQVFDPSTFTCADPRDTILCSD
ncbi:unnamed protein product [Allacma fusca]|uniref:Chitin-binding type-2 domain-containing protein n=1 Tax=Allacma fusca TaxID=39272 RepID=A0A8J2NTK1_9HEXA|nr:unnamed protein product [Allacma fusca]